MKVAVLYLGNRGGGNTYTLKMGEVLDSLEAEKEFFLSEKMENLADFEKKWKGIHTFGTFSGILSVLAAPFNAWKVIGGIRRFGPDVIYIPMLSPLVPLVLLYPWKAKKIFTFHGQYPGGGVKQWFIERAQDVMVMQSDWAITLSKHYQEIVEKRYKKKAYLVPLLDIGYYEARKNGGDGKGLLFVGRVWETYKGGEVMVEAFRKAREKIPGLRLVIAGSGSEKYSNEKGITAVDKWLSDEEFGELMDSSDIVCVPYVSPTPSGVVSTAMGMGKAVIASDLPGMNEQIRDGESGLLFRARDADALAEKIVELVNDEKKRRRLGEEARRESRVLVETVRGRLKEALNGK